MMLERYDFVITNLRWQFLHIYVQTLLVIATPYTGDFRDIQFNRIGSFFRQ